MNWKHLLWIVPLSIIISAIFFMFKLGTFLTYYPAADCMLSIENSFNVEKNKMYPNKEIIRLALQEKCIEYYDTPNKTSDDLIEMAVMG